MYDIYGHRQRVCLRFKSAGKKGLCEHELLEMLLFYAIARKDVKPLAKDLLNTFGSLAQVLEADLESLAAVKGMGEKSALLLRLTGAICDEKEEQHRRKKGKCRSTFLSGKEIAAQLLKYAQKVSGERLFLLVLDQSSRLIKILDFPGGGEFLSTVNRDIAFKVICHPEAKKLIVAHNHPAGELRPSPTDIANTVKVKKIFQELGITLIDHMIVAEDKCISLLKNTFDED